MAHWEPIKDKAGNIIKYKVWIYLDRDENDKQKTVTRTLPWPTNLTEKKTKEKVANDIYQLEQKLRTEYKKQNGKASKENVTLADFVHHYWWPEIIDNGERPPNSLAFYEQMSDDILEYFGEKILLSEIDGQSVLKYIKYLRTKARVKVNGYQEIPFSTALDDNGYTVLSWLPTKKALSYQVSRKGPRSKSFSRIRSTTETSFTDQIQNYDNRYKYCVKARTLVPGDKPYSKTTILRHYQTLCNILGYAVRQKYISEYPIASLTQNQKPKEESKEIDFLNRSQSRELLEALKGEPLFWRTYFTLLITRGLRRSEALALQWADIDEHLMRIKVERSVTIDKNSKTKYSIKTTKSEDRRKVKLTPRMLELLNELKKEQQGKFGKSIIKPTSFIFCRVDDPQQPIYPTEPTRWLRKFEEKNNLPLMSPHDLRHTAATMALESGSDIKYVQNLLGHKDPATTMKYYAAVTEDGETRAVEGIESLMFD